MRNVLGAMEVHNPQYQVSTKVFYEFKFRVWYFSGVFFMDRYLQVSLTRLLPMVLIRITVVFNLYAIDSYSS